MSLIPTAIELLNCAQETIDALKAERTQLIEAVLGLEEFAGLYDTVTPEDVKAAMRTERDLRHSYRAKLDRERELSARLREAAQELSNCAAPKFGQDWAEYSQEFEDAKKKLSALLAAKQDEAPRCKHGVHGNDCRQCYPTINDESI